MTKTPIHGLIKKRLAKDIGNCKSKRFHSFKYSKHQKNINSKKKL